MRFAIIIVAVLALFLSGCASEQQKPGQPPLNISGKGNVSVNSFEECAAAGYPIMESYPRQCRGPDGRNFVSSQDSADINASRQNQSAENDSSLGPRCCRECSEAYSKSPVAMGPHAAYCGKFVTASPLSAECVLYFKGNPSTVSRCGSLPEPADEEAPLNLTEGSCNWLQESGSMEKKLNVIFLPSHHYSDMGQFASDSAKFMDALFDFPFYYSHSEKINLMLMAKTSDSDGCYLAGNTTPACNISAMRSLAADCGFSQARGDQLVVLFDNGAVPTPYARGEDKDDILFIGSHSSSIFVHEFSHSFGDLGDTYDGHWNNTIDPEYPNCASDTPGYTCEDKWGDLIGTGSGDQLVGCFQNCHAENWYRPTQGGDIMRDASRDFYDQVALAHMESLMSKYE